jgi:hypothetical protein
MECKMIFPSQTGNCYHDPYKGYPMKYFQHSLLVFLTLKSSCIETTYDLFGKKVMLDVEGHSIEPPVELLDRTIIGIENISGLRRTMGQTKCP